MALTAEKLYKAHVLNLRAVGSGIHQIERELRASIARQDDPSAQALLKILLLLTGAWAECRLRKVLYEPNGFDDADRALVSGQRSQLEAWLKALEAGYRKRYNIPSAQLSETSLRATAWMRYRALQDLIETELRPVIEMRNTLAHGQWERPLNSTEDDISQQMLVSIRGENALSARFKLSLLDALSGLIHDLVSTQQAFERDFDKHYSQITSTRQNLRNRNYSEWKQAMVEKYNRGRRLRNEAISAIAGN
jgi:hypothetical protein